MLDARMLDARMHGSDARGILVACQAVFSRARWQLDKLLSEWLCPGQEYATILQRMFLEMETNLRFNMSELQQSRVSFVASDLSMGTIRGTL